MDIFKSYLNNIHKVNESTLDEYISLWNEFNVHKKQTLTVPGQTEKHLYFVISGIQKSYYLHKGKEHIIAFAYAPSFSGIPESFFAQKPSRYYLETITSCKLLRISYEHHQLFMKDNRGIETLFRKITEFFLDGVIQRQHEIMALNMEDRFDVFVKRSPHLLQLIPQKDIASYLRIDATNFSKLINRIRI
ncbi:Crp/Fnr family transcriptional regulator [Xanthovirga aplysinae]|uniref:Crp/Fnr family transcriptional regulator n=1 Tax=Xanthovirga aplysinae TaxID=2529853 RepID=UPI0012BC324D|nr:cyclic nucleotide-binding domain-containing protein [Xanthovirga aplysinae]MTI29593.1 Crp/Fnr family transcriptional regulator [Xanthovirga aplysinae]